ncbi:hypothetical protein [Caldicoprobacter sp.]|jgi:hypothetical protein
MQKRFELVKSMFKADGGENHRKLVIGEGGHRFYAQMLPGQS